MKSLKTNRAIAILILVCLSLISFGLFAQERELQTESDGFRWYELRQGNKRGAQSVSGTTFIPLSRGYDRILYISTYGGWFIVEKNSSEGACDITGREIVAPSRYDGVQYYNKGGYEYCEVKLNGKEGVCDINGREIIAPKYDDILCWNYCFIVGLNGKEGAFDLNGREIVALKYDMVLFPTGMNVLHYIDSSGKMVSTGISVESLRDSYSSISSSNSSSSSSFSTTTVTPTPTPQPQQQPIRQPQPMQVWKLCPYCQGSGKCHVCLGDGHPLQNPTGRCITCNGTGKCSHCAGNGGQNVIEYH